MKRCYCSALFAVCLSLSPCWAQQPIRILESGDISVPFPSAIAAEAALFRFGLPRCPPDKAWQQGAVLHTQWTTNGIRYTQAVFLADLSSGPTGEHPDRPFATVLLVNIEGENTTREYTEASAELALALAGRPQDLALKEGVLWRRTGVTKALVAALEVSDSGVKIDEGPVLQFSGNIPPSLKGAMTWKIPLAAANLEGVTPERLADIEFDREFRRARNQTNAPPGHAGAPRLSFGQDLPNTGRPQGLPQNRPLQGTGTP